MAACTISCPYFSLMSLASRKSCPVAEVAGRRSKSKAVLVRDEKGKCGASYIFRKEATVFFMSN